MRTQSFKDLVVWQRAYKLVFEIYKITKDFPKFETYGLAQQMRRAAVSIPSNIAEGYGRKHKAEYREFLSIAYGSLAELETQYLLSIDLQHTRNSEIIENLLKEVGGMLYRMMNPRTQDGSKADATSIRYTLSAIRQNQGAKNGDDNRIHQSSATG